MSKREEEIELLKRRVELIDLRMQHKLLAVPKEKFLLMYDNYKPLEPLNDDEVEKKTGNVAKKSLIVGLICIAGGIINAIVEEFFSPLIVIGIIILIGGYILGKNSNKKTVESNSMRKRLNDEYRNGVYKKLLDEWTNALKRVDEGYEILTKKDEAYEEVREELDTNYHSLNITSQLDNIISVKGLLLTLEQKKAIDISDAIEKFGFEKYYNEDYSMAEDTRALTYTWFKDRKQESLSEEYHKTMEKFGKELFGKYYSSSEGWWHR